MIPFLKKLPILKEALERSEYTPSIEEQKARIDQIVFKLNSVGIDPWGFDPEASKTAISCLSWLYHYYFRVEVEGAEQIPAGRALLISNHSGQFPIDALLIGLAIVLEAKPPRVARGMVERWAPSLPFVSTWFSKLGAVVGDPANCRDLLLADECALVFPEGVRGTGKLIDQKYKLQRFGSGFVRLALETQTPIVPIAVIGCEEAYPGIKHVRFLSKILKTPYFPITPTFPFLGPLGLLPLPTKVTIRIGEPIKFQGDPNAPDAEIDSMVQKVRSKIEHEIKLGLLYRKNRIFTGAAKNK